MTNAEVGGGNIMMGSGVMGNGRGIVAGKGA